MNWNNEEKIKQAEYEGNIHYCPHCHEKQPIDLVYYNPDDDDEPELIVCLICGEAIGFIDSLNLHK